MWLSELTLEDGGDTFLLKYDLMVGFWITPVTSNIPGRYFLLSCFSSYYSGSAVEHVGLIGGLDIMIGFYDLNSHQIVRKKISEQC
jgi:hypothetical protein